MTWEDTYPFAAAAIVVFIIVLLLNWFLAPFRLDRELRSQLATLNASRSVPIPSLKIKKTPNETTMEIEGDRSEFDADLADRIFRGQEQPPRPDLLRLQSNEPPQARLAGTGRVRLYRATIRPVRRITPHAEGVPPPQADQLAQQDQSLPDGSPSEGIRA